MTKRRTRWFRACHGSSCSSKRRAGFPATTPSSCSEPAMITRAPSIELGGDLLTADLAPGEVIPFDAVLTPESIHPGMSGV